MDTSFIATSQTILEVHKRIWQLFRIVSEQIIEWKCLAFVKVRRLMVQEEGGLPPLLAAWNGGGFFSSLRRSADPQSAGSQGPKGVHLGQFPTSRSGPS